MLVEEEVDCVHVTLGPSQQIVAWGGLPVLLGAMGVGGSLALNGHFFVGGLAWSVGLVAGSAMRMRGWIRQEAPLKLVLGARALEVRRVFRSRRLHTEVVPWSQIRGCTRVPRGLDLETEHGTVRLVCGFRTDEELDWVCDQVAERVAAWSVRAGDGEAEVDGRLAGLCARSSQQV
jgi:hypothetical protein